MYLHLGGDAAVSSDSVLGVFDLDNASQGKATMSFLSACEKNGSLTVIGDDLPKSFIICESNGKSNVYLSVISSSTILKRSVGFAGT